MSISAERRTDTPRHRRLTRARALAASMATAAAIALAVPAHAGAEVVRLTCDDAVSRALTVSHAAAAAEYEGEAAAAAAAAADAARLPLVTAAAAINERSSVPEYRLPLGLDGQPGPVLMPDIRTTYVSSIAVQQPLYAGGSIEAGRHVARSEEHVASAAHRAVAATVRLETRTAYWSAVAADARVHAARSARERADRLVADTQAVLEAGMAVRADLLAAQERSASARVVVIRGESAAATARSTLASRLALEAPETIELADSLAGTVPPPPPPLRECQESAAARPELASLEARRAALAARERLSLAAARPIVSAAAQWDLGRPNGRYFPATEEWNTSWSVGLAATWTLFDGGRATAAAAAVRATSRSLELSQAETRRLIDLEVEAAWRRLTDSLAATGAADTALAAATERQRASAERLVAGLAAAIEVLDAEAALAAAEQAAIDVRAGAWMAAAALERAMGR